MKKLLTILLTALMVVTLGVVNVTAEEENGSAHSVTFSVDGEKVATLPAKDHYLNVFLTEGESADPDMYNFMVITDDEDKIDGISVYGVDDVVKYMWDNFDDYEEQFTLIPHEHSEECYTQIENVKRLGDGNWYKETKGQRGPHYELVGNGISPDYVQKTEHRHGSSTYTYFKLDCDNPAHNPEHEHTLSCYDVVVPLVEQKYFTIEDVTLKNKETVIAPKFDGFTYFYEVDYSGEDYIKNIDITVDGFDASEFNIIWDDDEAIDEKAYYCQIEADNSWYVSEDDFFGWTSEDYLEIRLDVCQINLPTLNTVSNALSKLVADQEEFERQYVQAYANSKQNNKYELLLVNYEDAVDAGALGVEYCRSSDDLTTGWKDASIIKYINDDGNNLYYAEIEINDLTDDYQYYVRYKGDEHHVSLEMVTLDVLSSEKLYDYTPAKIEFYKGNITNTETIIYLENPSDIEYERIGEVSKEEVIEHAGDPVFIYDGDKVLSYGEDYVLVEYDVVDKANKKKAHYYDVAVGVKFTDEYLNKLSTGTHNLRLHAGYPEDSLYYLPIGNVLVPTYRYYDLTINVKKHRSNDDSTYKVVATGIE